MVGVNHRGSFRNGRQRRIGHLLAIGLAQLIDTGFGIFSLRDSPVWRLLLALSGEGVRRAG